MSNDEVNQEKNNENKDYEILGEKYPNCDFSFKVIVIGNSSNLINLYTNNLYIIYIYRCRKVLSFIKSNKE